jgi:hypothetical protein
VLPFLRDLAAERYRPGVAPFTPFVEAIEILSKENGFQLVMLSSTPQRKSGRMKRRRNWRWGAEVRAVVATDITDLLSGGYCTRQHNPYFKSLIKNRPPLP